MDKVQACLSIENLSNDDGKPLDNAKWKRIYILPSNLAAVLICPVRRSVSELAQVKYVTPMLISKWKYEKLGTVVRVFQNTQNLVISRCCFAENGKEIYTDL